ncbi:MAG: 1-phosphofructokinase family hexose kinase [bacterium]
MFKTLTLNPCIDLNLEIEDFSWESPRRALAERKRPGGKGVNVSVVLALLGTSSRSLAVLGGPAGMEFRQLAEALLDSEKIDLRAIPIEGNSRTNTVITSRADNRQLKVNQQGPLLDDAAWKQLRARIGGEMDAGDAVILAGSMPRGLPDDAYRCLVEDARKKGCLVALDADGAAFREAISAGPDIVKPNREELERCLEKPIESDASLLSAARALLESGVSAALVTDGAQAAWFISRGLVLRVAPPAASGSPTGAGDAFLAGFLGALFQDEKRNAQEVGKMLREEKLSSGEIEILKEALSLAAACGTATASTPDTHFFDQGILRKTRDQIPPVEVIASQ